MSSALNLVQHFKTRTANRALSFEMTLPDNTRVVAGAIDMRCILEVGPAVIVSRLVPKQRSNDDRPGHQPISSRNRFLAAENQRWWEKQNALSPSSETRMLTAPTATLCGKAGTQTKRPTIRSDGLEVTI